jgi:hypothetical protein
MIPPNFVSLRKVYSIFVERYDLRQQGDLHIYSATEGYRHTSLMVGGESRRLPLNGGKTRVTIRDKTFLLTELYQK